jgi:hypothetical protein
VLACVRDLFARGRVLGLVAPLPVPVCVCRLSGCAPPPLRPLIAVQVSGIYRALAASTASSTSGVFRTVLLANRWAARVPCFHSPRLLLWLPTPTMPLSAALSNPTHTFSCSSAWCLVGLSRGFLRSEWCLCTC